MQATVVVSRKIRFPKRRHDVGNCYVHGVANSNCKYGSTQSSRSRSYCDIPNMLERTYTAMDAMDSKPFPRGVGRDLL
ncbi:uncharacterized protein PHALS_07278 [Plasmopara halstedii]|uniref:Uncharacterized protein n=1 Tax=Plasmopara halstedii TaxID=4781 RepID=A0A0P1B599_PLAHL|nr:uncharacterized protein PHALS_07278 [Plasmopara halstedii]CEG49518.1 hypothetical protein PHALS_07278 [Plasmopara halstedii]|eukprot:XP_024585887.1 hypothetical protein PHALS_07278 [Plasmopara halstedii]